MSKAKRVDAGFAPGTAVGSNVPRQEGQGKVTGEARYIDDLAFPGLLHGATVRSTIPAGRVTAVELDPTFDWSDFTVVDHRTIAAQGGRNLVALIIEDQPLLVEQEVRHQAEAILLLAHPDRGRLAEGLARVNVSYSPAPAVLDLDGATTVLKEIGIHKGDLEQGLAAADRIVEGTYRTGLADQLYIEPQGVVAVPGAPGHPQGITVYGSLQCPYYVAKALQVLFQLPADQVRVVQATTGGGFGGKEEYPSVIAGHAALLARAAGRPVKIVYDRHEDLIATTKRHPALIRHRSGVKRDGTLVAMEVDVRLDTGAYLTLSPVVLSRACIHATGPYRVPHVRIRGRAMQTNTPPTGAYRGFGAPQSEFAAEVHIDRIAAALGLDPVDLRRRNLLRPGDTTATGQRLEESVSAEEVLDRALARHRRPLAGVGGSSPSAQPVVQSSKTVVQSSNNVVQRSNDVVQSSKAGPPAPLRGTGVALFFHGSGFTGGGEVKLAARAGLELLPDGVRILVASTEIGQGTRTMLAQIVADTLDLPLDAIETFDPDTSRVPDSGPTVASRTCMIIGGVLQRAAQGLRERLGAYASPKEFRRLARARLAEGPLVVIEQYAKPGEIVWSDETYQGDAYGAYAWGCNIADVEVDPLTYQARCTRFTAVIDVGKAIHPQLVEGQIQGGTLQGIGWALLEEVVMRDGRMQNAQLTNYIIPTTLDTPPIDVEIVENPYRHGPFGAKGVGECPIDGPAPAIANALRQALGRPVDEIPATPERIMRLLQAPPADAQPGRPTDDGWTVPETNQP